MKKFNVWIMMILMLFGLIGCESESEQVQEEEQIQEQEQNDIIGRYKSEARYYYEQVNSIITELNVIEEVDNSIENIEDNFFSDTLCNATFRTVCLENLTFVNQYYNALDICSEQMESLYDSVSQNEEINEIHDIVVEMDTQCNDLKKLLEESMVYDSDFKEEYNNYVNEITNKMSILFSFVEDAESAVHSIETNNEYQEELEEVEQIITDEMEREELLPNRDVNNPILEGEVINIKFLDSSGENASGDPYTVDCNITFKSYDKENQTVCLNFEIISSEQSSAVHVGNIISDTSSFVYMLVDENLVPIYADRDAVYGEETWNSYISAYEGGNVDCHINVQDYKYLQISFSPATEENKELLRENKLCTEEIIWFKLE